MLPGFNVRRNMACSLNTTLPSACSSHSSPDRPQASGGWVLAQGRGWGLGKWFFLFKCRAQVSCCGMHVSVVLVCG